MEKEKSSTELIDVSYVHPYSARGSTVKKIFKMHPYTNVKGEGAGMYSIRKGNNTRAQEYLNLGELAELFAIDGFKKLDINLRMKPIGKYDGGAPPGLQPSSRDVIPKSVFDVLVNSKKKTIENYGISVEVSNKLKKLNIFIPEPIRTKSIQPPKQPIDNNGLADIQSATEQQRLSSDEITSNIEVKNFTEFENEVNNIEAEQKKLAEYMSPTEINVWVKRRIGQGPFRTALLQEFGNKCAISELSDARLLVASHIRPWSECDEGQHRDINNGLLLSVTWDALFDKNLISFNDDGTMLISELLDGNTLEKLGVSNKPSLPESYLKTRREFLEYHRKNLLKKTSHS